jgi:hypothetical protein
MSVPMPDHFLCICVCVCVLAYNAGELHRTERELVTPPLDGTILPGVTRQSILDLARGWNEFKVAERTVTMPQLAQAAKEKRVRGLLARTRAHRERHTHRDCFAHE